ncbi:phosphatidylserine/phosphatidylglycerophosphate/cardiolipin synthase family protein [Bdellovibrio sp. SKB1291214]|uniref:phospholipase D-like domain-containing protein n=1 Tax=Bdellovibrio sp. SKB1291214 TaxID=1732569 RepID=UPI000B5187A5|nr:phosphatidylserine/phosphatidylglycerophosphate/cardiolipin synthase family protein [Bdellovibrio sp. SKB1291214]UYL08716.1 phosphatidylserine/phosphatidylglycerophosphate/cardiolipin synthase family protein [Bdellovibrio sp. SKB1291214]
MRGLLISFTISILFGLLACTSAQRGPSSIQTDEDRIVRIQEIDLQLSQYWNNDWRYSQKLFQVAPSQVMTSNAPLFDLSKISDPQIRSQISVLLSERQSLRDSLSRKFDVRGWSGVGPWFQSTFRRPLFEKQEIISIKDLEEYRLSGKSVNPFPLEHRFFADYSVRFKNEMVTERGAFAKDKDDRINKRFLKARLECDGDILAPGKFFWQGRQRVRSYDFNWYYSNENNQNVSVQFDLNVSRCQFKYYDPEHASTWTNGFPLASLREISPEWMKLTQQIDICPQLADGMGKNPDGFFWMQDFNFTTCPQTFDKYTNLRDPYLAMNRRVISLTGSPLNRLDFNNKFPMAPLNFDKAPRFDIIWISSLNFSADFSGMVTARAVRYHAERGTQVRILVPQVTMTRKDREIVNWLMRDLPNVKVQYYKYSVTDDGDGTWFDRLHRVNHTKLLLGYSSTQPDANFLITGGRNIRDSYIFPETPFYRAYKNLKNYGDGEEAYIYYNDFEIELRGSDVVKHTLAQMLNFWNREGSTHRFRSSNVNIPITGNKELVGRLNTLPKTTPMVRHIMSLPYFDGYQLERFYIEMIDSAQKELLLTTPYFRPSVAISAALDRAHARGVNVKVVTRIHLAGDGTPQIAEEVNKEGINRHLKNVMIYEWTESNSIMHAKILVIDGKLSFVSSVNLNRRSFIHDTESGVLILHEPTSQDLRKEVLSYLSRSRLLTTEEKIGWISGHLIDWADSYF